MWAAKTIKARELSPNELLLLFDGRGAVSAANIERIEIVQGSGEIRVLLSEWSSNRELGEIELDPQADVLVTTHGSWL